MKPRPPRSATGDRPRPGDESGVVLVMVLFFLATSIALAVSTQRSTVVQLIAAQQRESLARAQIAARSGLAVAERALLDDLQAADAVAGQIDGVRDAWVLLGQVPIALDEETTIEVRVRDGGDRISINALVDGEGKRIGEKSREFLVDALGTIVDNTPELRSSPIANDEKRGDLADAILDWLDSDEETRLGTPEESYYARAASAPLNRRILSIDELADVPDMDPLLLEVLAAYFSPYPFFPTDQNGGGVNPNTAPPHVLSLMYTGSEFGRQLLNEDDVFRMVDIRGEGDWFCPGETGEDCVSLMRELRREGEDVFPGLQYQASIFHVEVQARFREARACIRATIDRSWPEGPATLLRRHGC